MAIAEVVDVCMVKAPTRTCSRSFTQNASRSYANGKRGGYRLHPSLIAHKGVIRQRRDDEPADDVYTEGTSEPASS